MWNYLSQVGWIVFLLFLTHITQAWQIDQMESFKMICISLLASLADQPTNNTTKQGLANIAPPHNRFMITTLSVPHQQFYKSKYNDSWYLWKFLQKEHLCHADWPVLLERMLMAATIWQLPWCIQGGGRHGYHDAYDVDEKLENCFCCVFFKVCVYNMLPK